VKRLQREVGRSVGRHLATGCLAPCLLLRRSVPRPEYLPGYDDDPDVLEAKAMATQLSAGLTSVLGPSNATADTSAMLMQTLFYDVVQKRLG
jgi:hypothetical protein